MMPALSQASPLHGRTTSPAANRPRCRVRPGRCAVAAGSHATWRAAVLASFGESNGARRMGGVISSRIAVVCSASTPAAAGCAQLKKVCEIFKLQIFIYYNKLNKYLSCAAALVAVCRGVPAATIYLRSLAAGKHGRLPLASNIAACMHLLIVLFFSQLGEGGGLGDNRQVLWVHRISAGGNDPLRVCHPAVRHAAPGRCTVADRSCKQQLMRTPCTLEAQLTSLSPFLRRPRQH